MRPRLQLGPMAGSTRGAKSVRALTTVVGLTALLNLAIYIAVALALGGDAINGHADSGRYYLAMHRGLTEVSARVFEFSRWYTYFLWFHFGIALVLSMWWWFRSRAPRTSNNRWRSREPR